MAVTTRLTWKQEKNLQNYFGGKRFSLLYKASIHEFFLNKLLLKCRDQGPTITVIYSEDHVFGAYMQEGYKEEKVPIILFAFGETEISECKIRPYVPAQLYKNVNPDSFEFLIKLHRKEVTMNSNTMEKLGLPQGTILFEECEVFRCEDLLDKRTVEGITELSGSLLSAMRTYRPYRDLVDQIRILLLGPVGGGKSSFFNSVKSVFRGHVTHQALVGSDTTGISEKYRIYPIKVGKDGEYLPFILCDSMGLGEKEGLCMDDIPYILKGHMPDRYQFNSMKPITPDHSDYIDSPLLKDRIHCVAFVFDANSIEHLSHEMVAKIKRIRRELMKCGVVHVVLLTHVDSMDLITKGDFIDIYRSMPVKLKLEAVHKKLGFTLSEILVVSNYTSEWELDPIKDFLILSSLRQMLWAADDFLEDLPLEET
ncbi:hypothetical protein MC885_001111, partial [Smutsia gigantea]